MRPPASVNPYERNEPKKYCFFATLQNPRCERICRPCGGFKGYFKNISRKTLSFFKPIRLSYCYLSAACAERYSGRTFWTTAPYPSNHLAYNPDDYFPPFMTLTIKFDEAEAYRKAAGCYLRKNQWEDLTIDVYL